MAEKDHPLKKYPAVTVSRADIENIKPVNNHVLLRQHSDNSVIKFNDTTLIVDPMWKPEFHVDRVFTVVALPPKLTINKTEHSMNWSTDNQLKIGDRVWINYLRSIKPIRRFECEGESYILIHYMYIYLALRRWNPEDHGYHILVPSALMQDRIKLSKSGDTVFTPFTSDYKLQLIDDDDNLVSIPHNVTPDQADTIENIRSSFGSGQRMRALFFSEVVMINGYVLFEPVYPKKEIIHQANIDKNSYGIVRFYGRPNRFYKEPEYFDDDYISSGQRIHLKFSQYAVLEDPIHKLFPWDVPLCVTQRRYICGVINPEAVMEEKNIFNFVST